MTTETSGSQALQITPVSSAVFDDYVLVARIGRGGMADVFLAMSEGPGGFRKLVVVKRMHPHLGEDKEAVKMFMDEARLAARLNHPNVVQTNKVGEWEGDHFLTMEYLDGQPMHSVLRRSAQNKKPMTLAMSAKIVSEALAGLHYAHEAKDFDGKALNLVHRDISPHNIFLTYDGVVKILDFGIAKTSIQESETRAGMIKGKFAYIAPEQAKGAPFDRRADVWAMGVVLWESVTGRRLFKGKSEVVTLNKTLTMNVPLASRINKEVPEELAQIIDKALQRDQAQRYATALDMKEDLDDWLAKHREDARTSKLSGYLRTLFADVIEAQEAKISEYVKQAERAREAFGQIQLDGGPMIPAMPPDMHSAASGGHPILGGISHSGLSHSGISHSGISHSGHSHSGHSHSGHSHSGLSHSGLSHSGISHSGINPAAMGQATLPPQEQRRTSPLLIVAAFLIVGLLGAIVALLLPKEEDPTVASNGPGTSQVGETGQVGAQPAGGSATGGSATGSSAAGAGEGSSAEGSSAGAAGTEGSSAEGSSAGAAGAEGSSAEGSSAEGSEGEGSEGEGAEGDEEGAGEEGGGGESEAARRRRRARQRAAAAAAASSGSAGGGESGGSGDAQSGRLTLNTVPPATVTLGGRNLGTTPLINIELPAGSHMLRLENSALGISTTYRVTIPPGGRVSRRVAIE